jgi:hypothetical protein
LALYSHKYAPKKGEKVKYIKKVENEINFPHFFPTRLLLPLNKNVHLSGAKKFYEKSFRFSHFKL